MQSLLDAPVPKSVKDNDKKKKGTKKKKGGIGGSSSAGDLLGLEDSTDINVGGADISMEESMGSKGSTSMGNKYCVSGAVDELSKMTGDDTRLVGNGRDLMGHAATKMPSPFSFPHLTLPLHSSFDLDEMLPSGPSSVPKPAHKPTPLATPQHSLTTPKTSSPQGYRPTMGSERRSRRASAISEQRNSSGFGSGMRRHSSATATPSFDAGRLSAMAKIHEAGKLKSSSDSDSDSDDDSGVGSKGSRNTGSRGVSPRTAPASLAGGRGGASSDNQVAQLRAEKEALIRAHATEISELKAGARRSGKDASLASEDVARLRGELDDVRTKYREQEAKRIKLEGELAARDLKATEERTLAQAHFNQTSEDMRRKYDNEARGLAESHQRSVAELKRSHIEEISSVRQRGADAQLLESLSSQIKQTAGTLKILENQMITSKMASESGRESQMEARERLLGELERNARESMERSESQAARLQGSVGSIEDVMRALRNQNIEERERLKGEHKRLESLQESLMTERKMFLESNQEERSKIVDRWAAFEVEKRKMEEDLSIRREEIDRNRATFGRERTEFARLQAEASRAAEAQVEDMGMEEKRLGEARQTLIRDVSLFEQRQEAAKAGIFNAEQTRLELDKVRAKLDEDTRRFQDMGEEIHRLGQQVHEKGAEAESKMGEAERIRMEGVTAQKQALAAKQSLEVDKLRLAEERRKADDERVAIAHEKMALLREQTNNRQLNLKLNSAVSVSKTEGGRMAWAKVGSGGIGNFGTVRNEPRNVEGYNREFLGQLRKQVDELRVGSGSEGVSEWVSKEDDFMNRVRRMENREGGDGRL